MMPQKFALFAGGFLPIGRGNNGHRASLKVKDGMIFIKKELSP